MTPAVQALMAANVGVYFLQMLVGPDMTGIFGLVPLRISKNLWLWQMGSYLFLHGSAMHLFFNLFALWMFGRVVEANWGAREFLKYYFITGLGAALLSVATSPNSPVPVIGASGAVYGLLVAFAMLYPDATIYLYFLIPMSARQLAILFGVIEFVSIPSSPGIARFAHLGGMITGFVYLRWWWKAKIYGRHWLGEMWSSMKNASASSALKRGKPRFRRPSRAEKKDDVTMEEVDHILDKILVKGIDSLTDREREIMRQYSSRHKG
ncbi:MAG: rhomboid family intramembrane serine protease [Elusimicrobia bacterium]|nr:rhomboid family intramembrane serine protease [Elusimicrobiota bacterium]